MNKHEHMTIGFWITMLKNTWREFHSHATKLNEPKNRVQWQAASLHVLDEIDSLEELLKTEEIK